MRIASKVALFVAGLSSAAGAEAPVPIIVERGQGAEQCPAAEAVTARVEQIRGRREGELAGSYRVVFTRDDGGFSALISAGSEPSNVRKLESRGPSCSPLANAAAVTLALLIDSHAEAKGDPAPPPSPAPLATVSPTAAPVIATAQKPARALTVSAGGMVGFGVLGPASMGLTAEVGIALSRWRMNVGGHWMLPQAIALGPGTVREQLLSAFVRGCWAPWQNAWLRVDACSGAMAGRLAAEGQGYTRNEREARPWVAVPFEVAVAGWKAPIGWELGAAGLAVLERPHFSVDGVGIAYRSPPVAAMLSLRVMAILPW